MANIESRFPRKVMADMIPRVELALPGVAAMLRSAVSKPNELLMIEKVQERVQTSVVQIKNRLKNAE